MRDGAGVLLGMVGGALLGGVAGYLYLTHDGRRLRARLEPQLEELAVYGLRLRDSLAGAGDPARIDPAPIAADADRAPAR